MSRRFGNTYGAEIITLFDMLGRTTYKMQYTSVSGANDSHINKDNFVEV